MWCTPASSTPTASARSPAASTANTPIGWPAIARRGSRIKLAGEGVGVPDAERDEVFVCKPGFKTLKLANARTEVG